jgi:hypothetical protein
MNARGAHVYLAAMRNQQRKVIAMMKIEQVFVELKDAGQVRSTDDFSREWLGMEDSYLRCIRAKDRSPSPRALINCAVKLKRTGDALKSSSIAEVKAKGERMRTLARDCVGQVFGDDLQDWIV